MKKILFSAFAVIAFSIASQAQFRVGIKGGLNESEQRVNTSHGNGFFANDEYRTWHAGLIADLRIAENLYLQPQLLYTRKGSVLQSTTGAADTKVRINYLEMPVNLLYKLPVGFGKIFAGAGAVVGYGFSGKQEQNGQKRKLYSDVKTWKHEDLSLSFTAGVEFNNGLFASVNSQKGLRDTYKGDNVSIKNRSVSVGYLIDWKVFRKKG